MSKFYGSVSGSAKTDATRQGTRNSGIIGHIRGWDVGVKVVGIEDSITGNDLFHVYMTGGSNQPNDMTKIGSIKLQDGEPTFFPI